MLLTNAQGNLNNRRVIIQQFHRPPRIKLEADKLPNLKNIKHDWRSTEGQLGGSLSVVFDNLAALKLTYLGYWILLILTFYFMDFNVIQYH